MEFATGVLDYGTAPEIHVDGVQRTTLISPGIVRVTLYAPFHLAQRQELRTVLHLLWDRERFLAAGPIYDRARAAVAFGDSFRLAKH
jgi:hypothetical protein